MSYMDHRNIQLVTYHSCEEETTHYSERCQVINLWDIHIKLF